MVQHGRDLIDWAIQAFDQMARDCENTAKLDEVQLAERRSWRSMATMARRNARILKQRQPKARGAASESGTPPSPSSPEAKFIKAYAQQVGKAVKEKTIAQAQTYQRGGSANLIKSLRAIPVVTP